MAIAPESNPTPDAFREVLEAACAGAPDAFRALYRQHAPALFGWFRARNVEDPEAATSEVLLRAFRSLDRFTGDARAFRAFLFTIARNLRIDDGRRRSRRPRTRATDPAALPDTAPTLGTRPEDRMLSEAAVRELLADLTPEQRDVILLRVIADLDAATTARVIGKSEGAVRVIQHRALAHLRQALHERGVTR